MMNWKEYSLVFSVPGYFCFLVERFFLTFSRQMLILIIAWHVYQLTKDPLALGILGLCESLPYILTSLLVDHRICSIEEFCGRHGFSDGQRDGRRNQRDHPAKYLSSLNAGTFAGPGLGHQRNFYFRLERNRGL